MYKMYFNRSITTVLFSLAILSGCATTKPSGAERDPAAAERETEGREPASMVGNQEWLNEVQDDFSRIADETSSRSVASRKPDILVERSRWAFQYVPANNRFNLRLDGATYPMIQTSLDDQDLFSFAAEGQTETPITLTFSRNEGRQYASLEAAGAASACSVELSFWDGKNKKYQKDEANIQGERCDRVVEQLRSYVP